jgi:hypothetical protein
MPLSSWLSMQPAAANAVGSTLSVPHTTTLPPPQKKHHHTYTCPHPFPKDQSHLKPMSPMTRALILDRRVMQAAAAAGEKSAARLPKMPPYNTATAAAAFVAQQSVRRTAVSSCNHSSQAAETADQCLQAPHGSVTWPPHMHLLSPLLLPPSRHQ